MDCRLLPPDHRMNRFLTLPDSEKSAVFRAVGESMGIPAGYVEKDFWVCWMLETLFTSPDLSPHLVFRGGTSLSKAYQAINRFSEDIDLSISRDWLGITSETDPALAENTSQAQQRQKQLRQLTREKLTSTVIPVIEKALADAPFDSSIATITAEGDSEPFDTSRDPYCIYFTYPSLTGVMPAGYISARVKLEFSARAEGVPEESRSVQSFAAQHYPAAFSSLAIPVTTVASRRTFWEKAFIIHEANIAPLEKKPQPRLARHYYDLYQLIIANLADRDEALFLTVREHRKHYFRQTWVDYESITPEKLIITPPTHLLGIWEKDYKEMATMIYGIYPDLSEVIKKVSEFLSTAKTL
jgi:Nucleotidyl transferase AbiEii toxin, Type IV TA system